MHSSSDVVQILLVEDSLADIRLTREALKETKIHNVLHVVHDGEAAMEFLHAGTARPDLILLDLNLPKKDGREVLSAVKSDPSLAIIPIVVLTTSSDRKDIAQSYRLHANCYIQKPLDLDRFFDIVRAIEQFWLHTAKLPPSA